MPADPATEREPIGWNIYAGASVRSVTETPVFIEFIPNEPVLTAVAADLADEAERHLKNEHPAT